MCGIVYVNRHDGRPAARSVKKRYTTQKSRGSEGFGYVAIKDNKVVAVERAQTEHEIMQKLENETAPEILFHHRMPTSTPNVVEAAHPIEVTHPDFLHKYYMVHNGVMYDTRTRKLEHEKEGFVYQTELKEALKSVKTGMVYHHTSFSRFNDSETLAIDTAIALERDEIAGIRVTGPAAVVGLQIKGDEVVDRFFYRNNLNPLYLHTDRTMTTLTSAPTNKKLEVPNVRIMRFNAQGQMEEHPSRIWVPLAYSYDRRVYGGQAAIDDIAKKVSTFLPPPKPREEPIIVFEDTWPELKDFDADKMRSTIRSMTEEVLWEEYKNVADTLVDLESAAENIDGAMLFDNDNVGNVGNIIGKRRMLIARIDRHKAYQVLLEEEIEERDKVNIKINKLV